MAEEERPGAVHLEFPEDVAAEGTDAQLIPRSRVRRPVIEDKSVKQAIELIERAQRPLLLIGAAANRKLTSKMLHRFVEKTAIPFFTTQLGKGVLDERNPLCLGTAALSSGDFVHRAIDHADLIINVGHDVVEKPPFFMTPRGLQVIHINFFSAIVDPVYFPQLEVIGDIANSVWQISEGIKKQSSWDTSYFLKVRNFIGKHLLDGSGDERFPIFPPRIVAEVRRVMPSDGIIALDNGVYKIWFARNYQAHQQNTVLLDNALATMGAGLPSAMAARLVYPERLVVAICGDGGFLMNSQELETAVRLKMNLVILILRDDAYGMIRWKQAAMHFPDYALTFGNPNFVKYAESYGAEGHRVTCSGELYPLMANCLSAPGVHVIDVPIDYSENDRILNREIKEKSKLI
jgi:acetolactate synthase I/II/III large subunit